MGLLLRYYHGSETEEWSSWSWTVVAMIGVP